MTGIRQGSEILDEAPQNNLSPHILPIGTQVVALQEVRGENGRVIHHRGAAGVVIQSPSDYWHSYRVHFLDGTEAAFARRDIAVLSHYQDGQAIPVPPLLQHDLFEHVIFRCVIGSRAYGLDHEASDHDRRGIYLPPAVLHWSLYGVPEQIDNPATEETYWEIQKFLTLALKSNPNVLECLYSPIVEHASPVAEQMLAMRSSFLSKLVYQTYSGYVMSQFKKLQADLRNKGAVKWKHVMHLLRLQMAGITIMREGHVPVRVEHERDRLLEIRAGETSFENCEAWRRDLQQQFEHAAETTKLPDRPDYQRANALLLDARRAAL